MTNDSRNTAYGLFTKPSFIALFRRQHIQMQRGNILNIKIGFFHGVGGINHLHISFAYIAHINPVPLFTFHGKISQSFLFLISAKRAFDRVVTPFQAALIAEEKTLFLIAFQLTNLRLLAADRAISLPPFRSRDDIAILLGKVL
jgi:hypothetical protein